MTKYFTQWDSDTIGSTEAGWTQLGGATTAHVPAYAATTANPIKRRYSALTPGSASSFELLQYDACNADANRANFDICTLVIGSLCTATTVRVAYARGQGSGTVTDHYSVSAVLSTGVVTLAKRVASANSTITTGTDSTTITPTSAWFVRFRGNGTTLQVRVWAASLGMAGEPTTWLINTTDSSLTAAGWLARGGFGSGLVTALAFWSVGTNGDSAPCPRTNTEYTAWLDSQNAIRCVLAEMSATGYDSGGSPYTKTVNVYLSNHGYTSQQQDTPSLRHYDNFIQQIPTFTREMSTALSGQATTGFGDLIISNPASTTVNTGVRDNWLRMKWNRNYVRVYLGDPSWPKHDFRLMIYGQLKQPKAPSANTISFGITDLGGLLVNRFQENRFSASGPHQYQQKPYMLGYTLGNEALPTGTSLEFQIHDGSVYSFGTVYDDGVPLTGDGTVSSVDTGTDTITTTAAHGLAVDSRITFLAGPAPAPPAGLSASVEYYVKTVPSTTTFTLAATRGGATINITGAGTGGIFTSSNWWEDASTGKFTVVANPAGRITCIGAAAVNYTGDLSKVSGLIDTAIFTKYALSLNFKDSASFTQLTTDVSDIAGLVIYDEPLSALDVLGRIAAGSNVWFNFTPDGLLSVGRLALPTSTAVMSFTESDVVANTLRLTDVILPIDRTTSVVRYSRVFLANGPLNLQQFKASRLVAGFETQLGSSAPAAGIPLDDRPDRSQVADFPVFESIFTGGTSETTRRETLYKLKLGIFEFTTRLAASTLNLGDTISLTHPRYEWKQWTGSDDASPDNTGTIDSRYAVVLGIYPNVANGTCKIKCMRQIVGYYPTTDLN